MAPPQDLRTAGDRIGELLDALRAEADPRTCARAEELVRLVTELYGAGLARVVEVLGEEGDTAAARARLLDDDLVASLLHVHGLHPEGLAARVEGALAGVRPFLAQHGGDVELVDIDADAGAVLVRLLGSCDGCPASSVTLRQAVERAITAAAPEIVIIDQADPDPGPAAPVAPPLSAPVTLGPKPAAWTRCPSEVLA